MLELRTLGGIDLRRAEDGVRLGSVLAQSKRMALLVYLACTMPRRLHHRDEVIPLFWAEQSQPVSRHDLSQTLYALNNMLDVTVFESCGSDLIGVDPAVLRCDAPAFSAAANRGAWQDAVSMYAGDFLPGWCVHGAPGFNEWADDYRFSLRCQAAHAAWSLAMDQLTAGDVSGAQHSARAAARLEPANETAVYHLMAALAERGERAAAVAFFDWWVARLRQGFDLEPGAEILLLARSCHVPCRLPARHDRVTTTPVQCDTLVRCR